MITDPNALRYAAACWDRKGDKLFEAGDTVSAGYAWSTAIALREKANYQEEPQEKTVATIR